MASTYTQIYIQLVFAVSGRQSVINPSFKETLYKYIGGTMRNAGQKLIAINGMPDHVHILIGLRPTLAISALVKDIKVASSRFINDKKLVHGHFSWQEDSAHSLTLIRTSAESQATSRTRSDTTLAGRSETNICRC